MDDKLVIAGRTFTSRLIVGTGKYDSDDTLRLVIDKSACEIITVAVRRVDFNNERKDIVSAIDRDTIFILPNTSGAHTAEEAIRIALLARAMGLSNWVKLEITPDQKYLLPDGVETLAATETLVKEGFVVLPYINADPVLAKRLAEAGAATVMPLGAPIGSNQGLRTIDSIRIIVEESIVPVIVDAGIGCPSDAAYAMEMGADAVMINTAIATSDAPPMMAEAFKYAVVAGRIAFNAGLPFKSTKANASSPLAWLIK